MKPHPFDGRPSWDDSAMVCKRCDQFSGGWQHRPARRWWHRLLRITPTWKDTR